MFAPLTPLRQSTKRVAFALHFAGLLTIAVAVHLLAAQPTQPQAFRDQVWFTHSTDGLAWEPATLLSEKASVPDVIRTSKGIYWAYWVDFTNATGPRTEKIGIARSLDGKNWEKLGTVRFANLGMIVPVDPDAVELPDGTLRMYFFDIAQSRGAHPIYSAISADGVNYQVESGTRIQLPEIFDPDLIKLPDGRYRMYLNNNGKIISATSSDGLQFALDEGIRVTVMGSVPGSIALPDGSVRLYTCDRGISAYRSTNGLDFSLERAGVININSPPGGRPTIICDPAVTTTPDGYLMLYKFNPGQ